MADTKISALTGASTPLAGTEVLPIVQGGATVKVAVSNLTAGRAVAATALTMSTGSLVPSTAGQGINFTANTPAAGMTSQLLNWYEEGTWTPAQGTGLTVVGTYSSSGKYTRIGRQVTIQIQIASTTTVAVGAGGQITSNVPFTAASTINAPGSLFVFGATGSQVAMGANSKDLYNGAAVAATADFQVTVTYFV